MQPPHKQFSQLIDSVKREDFTSEAMLWELKHGRLDIRELNWQSAREHSYHYRARKYEIYISNIIYQF